MKPRPTRVNPELQSILAEATEALRSALGDELRLIVLYGSYARGTAAPDSDVDLLVVLRSPMPALEETVSRITYDVMWRHDFRFLLAVMVLAEEEYRQMVAKGYSFARNVQREGIVLWRKAA